MKRFFWLSLVLLLLADVALPQAEAQNPRGDVVGRIAEVKGAAAIRKQRQAEPESLSAKDKARPLYPGEVLDCRLGCTLKIILGDDSQGRLIQVKPGTSYPIPNRLTHLGMVLPDWIRAGGTRAQGTLLVTPAVGSYVRPESFQFRWDTSGADREKLRALTLTLRVCDTDQVLWSEANIGFSSGRFTTGELRAKLKAAQEQLANPRLEVTVTSPGLAAPQRFCLRMITTDDEQKLQKALVRWTGFPEPISQAERGYEFYQLGLYDDAATEYELALQQAPESTTLLAEAIVVYYKLGDLRKMDELLLRLSTLSPHSDLYLKLKAVRASKED